MYIVISLSKGEISRDLSEKLKVSGFNKIKEGVWIGLSEKFNFENITKNGFSEVLVLKKSRKIYTPHIGSEEINVGSLTFLSYKIPLNPPKIRKNIERVLWRIPCIRIRKTTYIFPFFKDSAKIGNMVSVSEMKRLIESVGGYCFKISKLVPIKDWMHQEIFHLFKTNIEEKVNKLNLLLDNLTKKLKRGEIDRKVALKNLYEIKFRFQGLFSCAIFLKKWLKIDETTNLQKIKNKISKVKQILQ